ncbi:MAG: hypothetical protein K0S32_4077 [Bacteroidetes bacterium]|nr:hypothetical protein [Bacteroidota bacterium]
MRFSLFIIVLFPILSFSQNINQELKVISESEYKQSEIVPVHSSGHQQKITMPACGGNAANDNFANATLLTVNGASVSAQMCGTTEAGETVGCNSGVGATLWYRFVATASTIYVKIDLVTGSCFFGSAVYSTTALPTTACSNNPVSCQSSAAGPATQIHQLTNLTIGNTYHIQLTYSSGAICAIPPYAAVFNIGVQTANPGGYISNPAPINSCAAPNAGCYFNSPPTTAAVTSGCTTYSLNANSYSANAVWSGYFQFTNSPSFNTAQIQAIINSNCGATGNVNWLNWTIYSSGCGLITCGTLSNLTIAGLACGGTYILNYQVELANCTVFNAIWPYQNAPSGSPACSPLPIEILYFTAKQDESKVNVSWKTINEINSKEFLLEKSDDGINFKKLSVVSSQGASEYSIDDALKNEGVAYYRLQHFDKDNKMSYSKTISLVIDKGKELLKLVPNPSEGIFEILFSSDFTNSDIIIDIYDLSGRKVFFQEMKVDFKLKEFNASELPKGLYSVNIYSNKVGLGVTRARLIRE